MISNDVLDSFICSHQLNIKISSDEQTIKELIRNALELEQLREEALTSNKNNYAKALLEYDNQCNRVYTEVNLFTQLLLKKNKWTIIKSRDYLKTKNILSAVGSIIEKEITPPSNNHDHLIQGKHIEKLIQLTFLKESPKKFTECNNNPYIKKYSNELLKITNRISNVHHHPNGKHVIDDLKQLKLSQIALSKQFEMEKIDSKIIHLKNNWVRKLFGWVTGQNKKLNNLIAFKSILPLANKQLLNLGTHISTSYDEIILIHDIKSFALEISSMDLTDKRIIEIINHIDNCLLGGNKKVKKAAAHFLSDVLASCKAELKSIATHPTQFMHHNSLRKKIGLFCFTPTKDKEIGEIITEINNQLEYFDSPEKALIFLKIVNESVMANNDNKMTYFLQNKIDQYSAWNGILMTKNKLLGSDIQLNDIETFYRDTCALGDSCTPPKIQQDFQEIIDSLKNKMMTTLNNLEMGQWDQATVQLLRNRLRLFSLEKLHIPQDSNIALLKRARNELIATVVNKVNQINDARTLHQYTSFLTSIWPDKLFCTETVLSQAILKKRKNFMNYRIKALHHKHKEKLEFLKSSNQGVLGTLWEKITGDTQTKLTKDNILKYGELIIKDYFNEAASTADVIDMNSYALRIQNFEAEWIREEIALEVTEIENALNTNVNELLFKEEREKFSSLFDQDQTVIDIGRMLLQWKFINHFRLQYGFDKNSTLQQAGTSIIYKLHEAATELPHFLYSFLGSLSETQLDLLSTTLIEDPAIRLSASGELSCKDLTGAHESVGQAGRTVLRKSMLLSQMSELLKQELLAYINNEKINEKLFQEHLSFVLKTLKYQEEFELSLSAQNFILPFTTILKKELKEICINLTDEEKSQIALILEQVNKGTDMLVIIRSFPSNIINLLSQPLSSTLSQLKYFFADRFKNNIENILKENNIHNKTISQCTFSKIYSLFRYDEKNTSNGNIISTCHP